MISKSQPSYLDRADRDNILSYSSSMLTIISLCNNHNNNINHAIAKCGASANEKQHIGNAVVNPDILQAGRFW